MNLQVPLNHGFTRLLALCYNMRVADQLVRFTLGDVVRKVREMRREEAPKERQSEWTQEAVAERADIDKTALIRLENDPERVERRTIQNVARVLGVSLSDLYACVEQLTWIDLILALEEPQRSKVLALLRRVGRPEESQQPPEGSTDREVTDGEQSEATKRSQGRR